MTDKLFEIRYSLPGGRAIIRAWDNHERTLNAQNTTRHSYIDAELVWFPEGGRRQLMFPRGFTYCGVNRWTTTDGIEARELVTSLFTLKPGDTDSDYFDNFTPGQLAWVSKHADDLEMAKMHRYCDPETGEVRRS